MSTITKVISLLLICFKRFRVTTTHVILNAKLYEMIIMKSDFVDTFFGKQIENEKGKTSFIIHYENVKIRPPLAPYFC